MYKIDLIIPTRNRLAKLRRTLASIPRHDWIRVVVVCDGDFNTYATLIEGGVNLKYLWPILMPSHSGSVRCRNFVMPFMEDAVLNACDDIAFEPDAIETAARILTHKFKDDGVVGFNQERPDHNPAGVFLMGKKFLDRYEGRMPLYPGYHHFATDEVRRLAVKLGRFHYEPYPAKPTIHHYHPAFEPSEMDHTHQEARARQDHDVVIKRKRIEAGLLWGDKYEK